MESGRSNDPCIPVPTEKNILRKTNMRQMRMELQALMIHAYVLKRTFSEMRKRTA